MDSQTTSRFAQWFRDHAVELRQLDAEEAAEAIAEELACIDDALGLEVGEESSADEERELIVTAYSRRDLFPTVHEIVSGLTGLRGWQIHALKPPRGFDFSIRIGGNTLHANRLLFTWLSNINFGVGLIPQPSVFQKVTLMPDGGEDLGWLVLETGLGEDLSSRLERVEFRKTAASARPISDLAGEVRTRMKSAVD